MLRFFVLCELITALFLRYHDWVHFPPFTDIPALKKHHSFKERVITTIINTALGVIPLGLTLLYMPGPLPTWVLGICITIYGLLTIGTLAAWWIPYFFGSSAKHKAGFKEYENTHRFLPARGDNVVPNTLHVVMHLFIWACLGFSVYFLVSR